ncbi:probable phospho-2-dehydro-3-deoxyheptonate aldolase, chloroplastic [Olea europaea var. sylvestris]|uniref:probable phospho-2-dehydro-3-deoxyheptonate aldolase, chloroplastic n=1 Tax=Olea europaea var. sylvestris TaxID=158386 RepID=UPI000C1D4C16|nr:probable phospho-2-dehydro-3-deoxyheptonate aldolase, chloroplastic [Olea europaea var. sylvestris]
MSTTEFWTSHECLLLPYEQSLTRKDSTSGLHYGCSAHMLWVGKRTRQLDGGHVDFLRGVANPLGIKLSIFLIQEKGTIILIVMDLMSTQLAHMCSFSSQALEKMDPNELVNLIEILNPINRPGRITIIVRMCAESIRVKLPHLIRPVCRAGQIVTWHPKWIHKPEILINGIAHGWTKKFVFNVQTRVCV